MDILSLAIKRLGLIISLVFFFQVNSFAAITGITGPVFNLTTSSANIPTPDGNSVHMWGYGVSGSTMQYPGPTLIVNQGDLVTVNLTNTNIPMPVSILFPGQSNVVATGGVAGLLTQESSNASTTVTYTFTASNPGTYTYYSGTRPGLQVEMGLMGALIVRSATAGQAYNDTKTQYDREYLYILSEIDPAVHQAVEFGLMDQVDNTVSNSTLWFVNGRNAPDTLFPDNSAFLPNQPYGSLARMHPGEKVLMRVIGGGRELHPFHTHGNHYEMLARDGRLLSSPGSSTADLAASDYTLQVVPGATYDAIWTWTGEKLGFDIYGTNAGGQVHTCVDTTGNGFDDTTFEYCADHDKPIPVILPENQELAFGGFYSGSPFLGALSNLPPGEGGLNLNGGLFFMWHSHNERELTNDDIYPGGLLTMMVVEPHGAVIE